MGREPSRVFHTEGFALDPGGAAKFVPKTAAEIKKMYTVFIIMLMMGAKSTEVMMIAAEHTREKIVTNSCPHFLHRPNHAVT